MLTLGATYFYRKLCSEDTSRLKKFGCFVGLMASTAATATIVLPVVFNMVCLCAVREQPD